ncbi:MAG: 50S ribosomal protein L9 [Chloroflexota bacterium]
MKVYFLQDVPGVARAGEIKDVAEGYARNYLIPRRLAVVATEAVIEQVKARQAAEARRAAREAEELRELAARLEGLTVTVKVRAGKEGRLYGSVTAADIAEAIAAQVGRPVDRRRVELAEPIRKTGEYRVVVRLGRDLAPRVNVAVVGQEE